MFSQILSFSVRGESTRRKTGISGNRIQVGHPVSGKTVVHRELHDGRPLAASEFGRSDRALEKPEGQSVATSQRFRKKSGADELRDNEEFQLIHDRHPHIGRRIKTLWGMPAFQKYIQDLFLDTRGGTREGFASEVSIALFRLSSLHDELYPRRVRTNKSWDDDWLW